MCHKSVSCQRRNAPKMNNNQSLPSPRSQKCSQMRWKFHWKNLQSHLDNTLGSWLGVFHIFRECQSGVKLGDDVEIWKYIMSLCETYVDSWLPLWLPRYSPLFFCKGPFPLRHWSLLTNHIAKQLMHALVWCHIWVTHYLPVWRSKYWINLSYFLTKLP